MHIIYLTSDAFQKHLQTNKCFYSYYTSAIGTLTIFSTQHGIYKVMFNHTVSPDATITSTSTADYSKIILVGTPFQHKVWQATLQIPAGATTSYQQLAHTIGNPTAIRAAANALAANPVPYFIPCHRVIRSSGHLGGYAWGIKNKKILLQDEQSPAYRSPFYINH